MSIIDIDSNNRKNFTELSKEISYALRHAPWEYELEMDEDGFVPLLQLINAINESGHYNRGILDSDIEYIIETSDKKRF
jgi:putative RNA 2'-phosphotransferase